MAVLGPSDHKNHFKSKPLVCTVHPRLAVGVCDALIFRRSQPANAKEGNVHCRGRGLCMKPKAVDKSGVLPRALVRHTQT